MIDLNSADNREYSDDCPSVSLQISIVSEVFGFSAYSSKRLAKFGKDISLREMNGCLSRHSLVHLR